MCRSTVKDNYLNMYVLYKISCTSNLKSLILATETEITQNTFSKPYEKLTMIQHHNHASENHAIVCTYNSETTYICTVIELLEQKIINSIKTIIVLSNLINFHNNTESRQILLSWMGSDLWLKNEKTIKITIRQ